MNLRCLTSSLPTFRSQFWFHTTLSSTTNRVSKPVDSRCSQSSKRLPMTTQTLVHTTSSMRLSICSEPTSCSRITRCKEEATRLWSTWLASSRSASSKWLASPNLRRQQELSVWSLAIIKDGTSAMLNSSWTSLVCLHQMLQPEKSASFRSTCRSWIRSAPSAFWSTSSVRVRATWTANSGSASARSPSSVRPTSRSSMHSDWLVYVSRTIK